MQTSIGCKGQCGKRVAASFHVDGEALAALVAACGWRRVGLYWFCAECAT